MTASSAGLVVTRTRGAAAADVPDAGGDAGLGDGVDGGGRVVQDEDRRVGGQRAGQRDPLALAAGERTAALGDRRVDTVGQGRGDLVRAGRGESPAASRPRAGRRRRRGTLSSEGALEQVGVVLGDQDRGADVASGSRAVSGRPSSSTAPSSGSLRRPRQRSRAAASAGSVATTPTISPGAMSRSRPRSAPWVRPRSGSRPSTPPAGQSCRRPVPRTRHAGAASTSAIRAAEARPCASSALTQENSRERAEEEQGEPDGRDQLAEADVAAAASRPPTRATTAMKTPVRMEHDAVLPGLGAGGAQGGGEGVAAGAPVAGDGGRLGADALEHAQPGDQVGGDAGGVRGALLLGLAAPLQGLAQQVAQPQQQRGAEEDEQAERRGRSAAARPR